MEIMSHFQNMIVWLIIFHFDIDEWNLHDCFVNKTPLLLVKGNAKQAPQPSYSNDWRVRVNKHHLASSYYVVIAVSSDMQQSGVRSLRTIKTWVKYLSRY